MRHWGAAAELPSSGTVQRRGGGSEGRQGQVYPPGVPRTFLRFFFLGFLACLAQESRSSENWVGSRFHLLAAGRACMLQTAVRMIQRGNAVARSRRADCLLHFGPCFVHTILDNSMAINFLRSCKSPRAGPRHGCPFIGAPQNSGCPFGFLKKRAQTKKARGP